MLEKIEEYVFDTFIKELVFKDKGQLKIFKEDLEKLKFAPHETNFIMYVIKKKNIEVTEDKITKEDRSPYVRDHNYGDIKANELQKIDEPVMSKIEYSQTNDKIYEDYKELDDYLETRFIPNYVLLKRRKNSNGEFEYFPSIRLHHITALKLSEAEFEHVMNYLNEKNIHVGGKDSSLDGEFENYDYVSTYKERALPLSVPVEVTLEKAKRMEDGDEQAKNEIITDNIRLVPFVAYKYAMASGIDQHELESYGYFGLIKAVDRFDYRKGYAFSTFAVMYIKSAILKGILEIKNAKNDSYIYYEYIKAKRAVEKENGVTLAENPELIDDVLELMCALNYYSDSRKEYIRKKIMLIEFGNASLNDDEVVEELIDDGQLVDTHDYEEEALNSLTKKNIEESLETLTTQEAEVLRLRFGFSGEEPKTLEEVGKLFGVSRERIRQIEEKALKKLRHPSRYKKLRDSYTFETEKYHK